MPETKPRVVVADDEEVIANTLAMILNQAGFQARAVYSGESVLDILPDFRPDMLISDVIMQGITGIDTAIKVRSRLPSCKILLFSGQACTADLLEKARTEGHEFEILSKPVHPSELLARMRSTGPDRPGLLTADRE
jgi:DNA-binding response OmpR family regulator